MPETIYADPTTTMEANTKKILSILPPIQEVPEAPIARPIQNHATPRNLPPKQAQQFETAQPYKPNSYGNRPSSATIGSINTLRTSDQRKNFTLDPIRQQANPVATEAFGTFGLGIYDQLSGANTIKKNNNPRRQQITSGVTGGENLIAYEIGRRTGDGLQNLSKDANKLREDLWKNRPQFEIPQIKIPKLPHIPKIKIPDIKGHPDLKRIEIIEKQAEPKIPYKEPETPPKNNSEEWFKIKEWVKQKEFCELVFSVVQTTYYKNSGATVASVAGIPDEVLQQFPDEQYGGGATGEQIKIGNQTGLQYFPTVSLQGGNNINSNGKNGSDYLRVRVANIKIIPSQTTNVEQLEEYLQAKQLLPFSIYSLGWGGCKTRPQTKTEEPPPEAMKKKSCCPDIDYRKIQAMIEDAIAKIDPVSAIPLSWQIRNEGSKPQLIIQCAEENGFDKEGNRKYKSAMYPITVPHWDGSPDDKISLPSYIKGNYEGIYVLNDNSKVTINAKNEIECKRILNAIKPHIPKQYTTDAYFKGGMIVRDEPIKESRVKPRYGRYFKDGQKNSKPDWRIEFT